MASSVGPSARLSPAQEHQLCQLESTTSSSSSGSSSTRETNLNSSNDGIDTRIELVGRIARKKKRKLGWELALRPQSINGRAVNSHDISKNNSDATSGADKASDELSIIELPPILLWMNHGDGPSLVPHTVATQVGALLRVEYRKEQGDSGNTTTNTAITTTSITCNSKHHHANRVIFSLNLLECPAEPLAVRAALKEPSLWYALRPYDATTNKEQQGSNEEELDFHAKNQHYLVRQIVARLQRRPIDWQNHRKERAPQVTNATLAALQALEEETHLTDFSSSPETTYTEHDNLLCLPTSGQSGDLLWNLPTTRQGQDDDNDQILDDHDAIVIDADMPSNHHKLTRGEYLRTKKFPQIHWLLGRLQDLRQETSRQPGFKFRHVLDVGGGRGDLAFQVASLLNKNTQQEQDDKDGVHVTVIDNNESSLRSGEAFVERQQRPEIARRMHWKCQDFAEFLRELQTVNGKKTTSDDDVATKQEDQGVNHPNNLNGSSTASPNKIPPPPIDLVIAWHACGDLTDMAIDMALELNSALVACPCCFAKMTRQRLPPNKKVAAKMAELQRRPDLSRRGMHVINSLRLARFENYSRSGSSSIVVDYRVSLEEYSLQWSGRNQVLVAIPTPLFSNDFFQVVSTDHGWGCRALRDIPAWTLIHTETPLLTEQQVEQALEQHESSALACPADDDAFLRETCQLNDEARLKLWELHDQYCGSGEKRLAGIIGSNGYGNISYGNSCAVYHVASKFNHSCIPNIGYDLGGNDGWTIRFYTTREIAKGEPCCSAYSGVVHFFPKTTRQAYLKHKFNFMCGCTCCSTSDDDDKEDTTDQARAELKEMAALLEDRIHMGAIYDSNFVDRVEAIGQGQPASAQPEESSSQNFRYPRDDPTFKPSQQDLYQLLAFIDKLETVGLNHDIVECYEIAFNLAVSLSDGWSPSSTISLTVEELGQKLLDRLRVVKGDDHVQTILFESKVKEHVNA